jgi:hypothetical protein
MTRNSRVGESTRLVILCALAALTTTASVRSAVAQEPVASTAEQTPPGNLDPTCAADCRERGLESGHCARICWVPAPSRYPASELTDLRCLDTCRDRGGKYGARKSSCKRN